MRNPSKDRNFNFLRNTENSARIGKRAGGKKRFFVLCQKFPRPTGSAGNSGFASKIVSVLLQTEFASNRTVAHKAYESCPPYCMTAGYWWPHHVGLFMSRPELLFVSLKLYLDSILSLFPKVSSYFLAALQFGVLLLALAFLALAVVDTKDASALVLNSSAGEHIFSIVYQVSAALWVKRWGTLGTSHTKHL